MTAQKLYGNRKAFRVASKLQVELRAAGLEPITIARATDAELRRRFNPKYRKSGPGRVHGFNAKPDRHDVIPRGWR